MTYLWRIPDDYPQNLIGEYQKESSPDRFMFRKGEVLPSNVCVAVVKINAVLSKISKYASLPNSAMVPIIDRRLADLLTKYAQRDIQLFRVRVIAKDGDSDEFSILNVTNKVTCIDHKKSEYSLVPGSQQIMSFRRLEHLDGCLLSHSLARDSEYLSHLLVSDELGNAIIAAGFKGLALQRPNEISW